MDAQGKPTTDHIATLVQMAVDPSLVPNVVTIRNFGSAMGGDGGYMRELYVRQRGDAAIKTGRDMNAMVNQITDPEFWPSQGGGGGGEVPALAGRAVQPPGRR